MRSSRTRRKRVNRTSCCCCNSLIVRNLYTVAQSMLIFAVAKQESRL